MVKSRPFMVSLNLLLRRRGLCGGLMRWFSVLPSQVFWLLWGRKWGFFLRVERWSRAELFLLHGGGWWHFCLEFDACTDDGVDFFCVELLYWDAFDFSGFFVRSLFSEISDCGMLADRPWFLMHHPRLLEPTPFDTTTSSGSCICLLCGGALF